MFDSNEQALETLRRGDRARRRNARGSRRHLARHRGLRVPPATGATGSPLEDRALDSDGLIDVLGAWLERLPDRLHRGSAGGGRLPRPWRAFTRAHGGRVQIIGDDYLVTNEALVRSAIEDACLQRGARQGQPGRHGQRSDGGLRSGLARPAGAPSSPPARARPRTCRSATCRLGLGAGQLKVGSFTRSERMAKWNECLRIQDELGREAFVGGAPLARTWWGTGRTER